MAGKHAGGRPTVMTESTVNKLEEAFAYGATDSEACFYAGISKQTLYSYQDKYPEFVDRKEALKERPVLQARQTVVQALKSDIKNAQWYLERKGKGEFNAKSEVDVTSGGESLVGDPAKAIEFAAWLKEKNN